LAKNGFPPVCAVMAVIRDGEAGALVSAATSCPIVSVSSA
jgi:hypothetical protein